MMKKRVYKKRGQQRNKGNPDNLDDIEKEQLKKYKKKGKKVICDSLDDEKNF